MVSGVHTAGPAGPDTAPLPGMAASCTRPIGSTATQQHHRVGKRTRWPPVSWRWLMSGPGAGR